MEPLNEGIWAIADPCRVCRVWGSHKCRGCRFKLCYITEQLRVGSSTQLIQHATGSSQEGPELTRWSRCSGCRKSAAWRTGLWTCGSWLRGRFFASEHLCEQTCWPRPRWTTRLNSHQPLSPPLKKTLSHSRTHAQSDATAVPLLSSSVWESGETRSGALHWWHPTLSVRASPACLSHWAAPLTAPRAVNLTALEIHHFRSHLQNKSRFSLPLFLPNYMLKGCFLKNAKWVIISVWLRSNFKLINFNGWIGAADVC